MNPPISRSATLLLLAAALAGCDRGPTATITLTRTATAPCRPVKLDATNAERFDMGQHGMPQPGMGGGGGGPARERSKPLAWDLPAGWTERPDEGNMRMGSFGVAGEPDADCSIVLLPGEAGGLDANVNRWRGQLGLAALSPEELAKLPTHPLLGNPALVVDATGSYKGMGQEAKANFKLLGLISQIDAGDQTFTLFVKLTGPAALVDAQRAAFFGLCDSLRFARRGEEPQSDKPPEPEPPADVPQLAWDAPQDWKKQGPKPMRVVTFLVRATSECYVSALPGNAGGFAANLNRWRHQMGQAPLDDASIAALPKVKLLGQDVPLIDVTGTYADMQGETHGASHMLGAIAQKGDSTVFVKFVGPESEVGPERERFLAFVSSIR